MYPTQTKIGEQDIIRTDISSLARNRWWDRADRIFLPIQEWRRIAWACTCTDTQTQCWTCKSWWWSVSDLKGCIAVTVTVTPPNPSFPLFLVLFPLLFNSLLLYRLWSSSTNSLHPSSSFFLYCVTLKCYGKALMPHRYTALSFDAVLHSCSWQKHLCLTGKLFITGSGETI